MMPAARRVATPRIRRRRTSPMLDADLKAQLKAYLECVTRPIEITASVDDGAKSAEMLALLEDLKEASERISVRL